MATIRLVEGETLDPVIVTALTQTAVGLNADLGDPTRAAGKGAA